MAGVSSILLSVGVVRDKINGEKILENFELPFMIGVLISLAVSSVQTLKRSRKDDHTLIVPILLPLLQKKCRSLKNRKKIKRS